MANCTALRGMQNLQVLRGEIFDLNERDTVICYRTSDWLQLIHRRESPKLEDCISMFYLTNQKRNRKLIHRNVP